MRVNTPDMSDADAVVVDQVPGSVTSHNYGRDRDTMAMSLQRHHVERIPIVNQHIF